MPFTSHHSPPASQSINVTISSTLDFSDLSKVDPAIMEDIRKVVAQTLARRCPPAHLVIIVVGDVVAEYDRQYISKKRKRTSAATRGLYMRQLLVGDESDFRSELGMNRNVFLLLAKKLGLSDSKHMSALEQLGIFLWICTKGASNNRAQERWQYSGYTISKYFKLVCNALVNQPFYNRYVRFPSSKVQPGPSEQRDAKYWPFFDGAIGAIDSVHFDFKPQARYSAAYRNRKGTLSQNVLAACDFDNKFTYVLSGWEGSVSDSRLWNEATTKFLKVPEDCYFLADSDFPLCQSLMVPVNGVRYDLKEWSKPENKPENATELFNLRHSSLRNIVDSSVNILKRRNKILQRVSDWPVEYQVKVVPALCVVHNFIRKFDPLDLAEDFAFEEEADVNYNNVLEGVNDTVVDQDEERRMENKRQRVADDMWASYETEAGEKV